MGDSLFADCILPVHLVPDKSQNKPEFKAVGSVFAGYNTDYAAGEQQWTLSDYK